MRRVLTRHAVGAKELRRRIGASELELARLETQGAKLVAQVGGFHGANAFAERALAEAGARHGFLQQQLGVVQALHKRTEVEEANARRLTAEADQRLASLFFHLQVKNAQRIHMESNIPSPPSPPSP